jgi:hypothetical protein
MTSSAPRAERTRPRAVRRRWSRAARSLVLLAGIATAGALAPSAGAIVGGAPTKPSAHPQIVKLPGCTGSLIAPDRVLTAAHCLDEIQQGTTRVRIAGRSYRVVHVARHPDYTYEQHRYNDPTPYASPYDAAILQLDRAVPGIAPLPLRRTPIPVNRPARIIGYGQDHPTAGEFGTLRTASVVTRSTARCVASLRRADRGLASIYQPGKHICTQDPDDRKPFRSACYGDSGGPLLLSDGHRVEIAGIDATSANCGATHNDPTVFDSIVSVLDFVTAPAPAWWPTPVGQPRVEGTRAVGQELTCVEPAWEPTAPTSVTFTWAPWGHGGGKGTSGQRRTVQRADAGHRLACTVIAAMPGGGDVYFNSAPVPIASDH